MNRRVWLLLVGILPLAWLVVLPVFWPAVEPAHGKKVALLAGIFSERDLLIKGR